MGSLYLMIFFQVKKMMVQKGFEHRTDGMRGKHATTLQTFYSWITAKRDMTTPASELTQMIAYLK